MFSDTQFWRLVWKEYRVHRPLWLVLLVATPLLQCAVLAINWVDQDFRPLTMTHELANGLMALGFVSSVIFLLGCSGTMFSVEHETGTFDFQRVLPANQPRVFWAKVSFAFVSGVLLNSALWLVTRGVFLAGVTSSSTWFGTYGLLYMAEVFAWSILASLLIRQPLWGVIGAIALQSLTLQVVLSYLTTGRADGLQLFNEDRRFTLIRFAVLAVLIVADIVLGKLWFEDRLRLPRWRFRWKPDFAPSYATNVELPVYVGQRQIGWSRMLWLSWRDGRWVMAGVLAIYGYFYLTLRHPNDWEGLMVLSFVVCFVFGLLAFAPEQWGGRFRFMTEHGCSPRTAWLCRQVIWLPPMLLIGVGTNWMRIIENQIHPHSLEHAASDVLMATVIPLICYSAGQFAAMLFRSTVMAIAIGFALCVVGGLWGGLMTSWLAPTWWTVGSLPVIGLFVTWLKANDWVEERRDRTARWRTVLGLGVPVVLLLISTATYRVVQIPVVTLPREWDETPQILARLTPAEKETLAIYRRALAEIEAGEVGLEPYQTRLERLRKEHVDWTNRQVNAEAFDGFQQDWWKQHVVTVPLLREAHRMAPVPLDLAETDERGHPSSRDPDRTLNLPRLMVWQAEESLRDGNLEQTWENILVAFELQRRYEQRASLGTEAWTSSVGYSIHESQLLQIVAKWGRHPDQTRDRIVTAIRKLEEFAARRLVIQREVHHELLEAQSLLNADDRWKKYLAAVANSSRSKAPQWDEDVKLYWKIWTALPWEHWRAHRAVRLHAWLALTRVDQLQTLLKWNVPQEHSVTWELRKATLERAAALAPEDERIKLLAVNRSDQSSAEHQMLRATLLPSRLGWWSTSQTEYRFWDRAAGFRVTMLLLALADFHREQGRYPESLDELVPAYFAETPRDPNTAGPFVYFPHGVPEDVIHEFEGRSDPLIIVRKEIPFLLTRNATANIHSRLKSDGTWEFTDDTNKPLELLRALGSNARVWTVREP